MSLGALFIAAVWMRLGLPWPYCVFRALTGHPCLTCGATRSAIAFFHGNFPAAVAWNPLVFVTYVGIIFFDIYAFAAVVLRTRRLRVIGSTQFEKNFIRWAVVTVVVINWGYLLAHSSRFA